MWFDFAGMILLFLHTARSQENTKIIEKLEEIAASPGDKVQLRCKPQLSSHEWSIIWYKERQDKSLQRIYVSFRNSYLDGKYSGRMPNLTISNVQRNDSGVYYCGIDNSWNVRIVSGARLIITGTPRPRLSTLVPSSLEGMQLDDSVPLLCLMSGASPAWDNFSWDISKELSQDQKGVGEIDKEGVFSIWHLEMIPRREWTEEKARTCSLQENRDTSAAMPTDTGNCRRYLYLGIPSIIVLLVLPLILLFRKHLARRNAEQGASQTPLREIPQTDYAEVHYRSGNVLCED
ncbi:uncharacterized protein LOC129340991 [Eublepharis macularius]|uniref:Uncharacterized protein LOC129340991 n=1 Tax=Eublepharis macularius TaxID=481883 RepID=A0AA97LDF9_EUBMA|nr:uncharacterized protein LOC129340991 [Eublepharis macularius]